MITINRTDQIKDGGWSVWSNATDCCNPPSPWSITFRLCNSPLPKCGGKLCESNELASEREKITMLITKYFILNELIFNPTKKNM